MSSNSPFQPYSGSRGLYCLGIAILLVFYVDVQAQGQVRSWGMGDAMTASARGLAAVQYNPANLALSPGQSLGLASAAVSAGNNSLGLDRYNELNGSYLDAADKDLLLADIPAEGFALDAKIRVSALGYQSGRFAFSLGARGQGRGNLDRDYFSLVLYGNPLNETVDFSNTWGGGYAVGTATISYGQVIHQGDRGTLAMGLNGNFLQGLYEIHIQRAGGTLTTSAANIGGSAYVDALSAEGGQGYGFDWGLTWQTDNWQWAAMIENAASQINWDRNVQLESFQVTATAISLLNGDLGSSVIDTHFKSEATPYTTRLPRAYHLGLARDWGAVQANADLVVEESIAPEQDMVNRVAMGAEFRLTPWLYPRAGIRLEEGIGTGGALGLGIDAGHWLIDAAAMTSGGLLPGSAKGFGVAVGTHLVF